MTKTAITSSIGTSLPAVTDEYDSKTGMLVKRKTTVEGVVTSLSNSYDALGELVGYTDADGTASSYEYDVDGRTKSFNDGKGTQTYKYDATTGLLTELIDTAAGTIQATYDVEGNPLTESYPNWITASQTYNSAGEPTHLEDNKLYVCGSSCTWFNQTLTPSIHGQILSQSNTLAQDSYKYDEAGRLTEVKETPAGQGCLTRLYAYDAETNRTSVTSREPGSEGKCATAGGTVRSSAFDSGNRLTDTGVKYDSFGDTSVMPAPDAGGSELTSSFYTDGRLASMMQAGETVSYQLDPSRRVREIVSTGNTSSTVVNHYAGSGDAPSWTVDLAGKWTRYIRGIGGELTAIQTNGGTPVFQLTDLQSNVVATASAEGGATALLTATRSTEYGVPTTSSPSKYSWLGGRQRPTELPLGAVAMGARGYVPQLGRFLQADPLPGGSDNPYAYTDGDPLNTTDLGGEYVEAGYVAEFNEEEKERAIERRIAAEEAAREEAERKAEEAAAAAVAVVSGHGRKGHGGAHQGGGASASGCGLCHKGTIPPSLKSKGCKTCKANAKRRKEKEKREREKEEIEKEIKEHPCTADYEGSATSARIEIAEYYEVGARRRFVGVIDPCNEIKDPGPGVDPPCVYGCEGGLEAWQQWPGEEGVNPGQLGVPHGEARAIRV